MGKGYIIYMKNKYFLSDNKEDMKRFWMSEQETKYVEEKEKYLLTQYQTEQEVSGTGNSDLPGDERVKYGPSFMCGVLPGIKKEETEKADCQQYKLECQRQNNVPTEIFVKHDHTIYDHPLGMEVTNVRCMKCRKWGHMNTDKNCSLFGQNSTSDLSQQAWNHSSHTDNIQEDGMALETVVMSTLIEEKDVKTKYDEDKEMNFLKSVYLNRHWKKLLLKRYLKFNKRDLSQKNKSKKRKN